MRVVVTGSRHWRNEEQIKEWFLRIPPDTIIIHGDAPTGVDFIVDQLAKAYGFWRIKYPAPWNGTLKKRAGPARNTFMLMDSRPDCVKAFRAPGESPGTDGCIQEAKMLNLPTNIELEKDSNGRSPR